MAQGKKPKPITVDVTCLHCGKSFVADIIKIVDEAGTPAVFHYAVAETKRGRGGLYDDKEE